MIRLNDIGTSLRSGFRAIHPMQREDLIALHAVTRTLGPLTFHTVALIEAATKVLRVELVKIHSMLPWEKLPVKIVYVRLIMTRGMHGVFAAPAFHRLITPPTDLLLSLGKDPTGAALPSDLDGLKRRFPTDVQVPMRESSRPRRKLQIIVFVVRDF